MRLRAGLAALTLILVAAPFAVAAPSGGPVVKGVEVVSLEKFQALKHRVARLERGKPTRPPKPTRTPTPTVTATPSPTPSPPPSPSPTPTATATPTPTPTPPPPTGVITNLPAQPAALAYQPNTSAAAYAKPGALVIAGRDNYADPTIRNVAAAGGHFLLYLDPIIDNAHGRYASLMLNSSACGAAVPRWPGNYQANQWGYLTDFRPGSVLQGKFECVLETMVRENPHMAGWFLDDLGSRSWFPNLNWSTFPDRAAYRNGAIELAKTARRVADRHGMIVLVNGTWGAGDGGGYPDANRHGLSLADGGFVENHDGQIGYFGPYGCSSQWASASAVTRGKAFNYALVQTSAGLAEYRSSGCYAYVGQQNDYGTAPAPWGPFHPTGLPPRT